MNKSALLALACAALVSGSAFAQAAPEVTYVEDPAQGYTLNRFKDNWFITAEGGVNYQFSDFDQHRDWSDRFAPAFGLQAGKWFSPLIGFRGGVSYLGCKGLSTTDKAFGIYYTDGKIEKVGDYYKTKVGQLGIDFDAMLNITNWWCGYKPNRVYNFIAYVGGAGYFGFQKNADNKWNHGFDTTLGIRGGIINSFNVSKQVALSLDIRYTAIGANRESNLVYNRVNSNVAAFLGVTYLFKQRTWSPVLVPVCPPAENCDAIAARLAETEARLADTQRKLDECLRRPMPTAAAPEPCNYPLATVYFPCGVSAVSATDTKVLKSVAAEMANSGDSYEVIGWADKFTGNDAINARLRTNRANNVKKILVNAGVPADRINAVSSDNVNRLGGDRALINLDRCVTIEKK